LSSCTCGGALRRKRRVTTRRARRSTARVQVDSEPIATEQSEGCETASAIPMSHREATDDGAQAQQAPPLDADFWQWCRFRRTFVAIVLLTYSVTLKTTVDVLDCRSIGGERVLRSDVRASCANARYGTWANLALFFLLPYLAIVTLAVPLVLYAARRRNGGALPRSVALGALYDIYRPEVAHAWETVVLVRRLAVGVIDIVMPNTLDGVGARYFALNVVNTLALASTLHLHPLQSNFEHWLDVFQLAWLVLIGNNLASLEQHTSDAWSRVRVGVVLNELPLAAFVAAPLVVIGGAIVVSRARALVSQQSNDGDCKEDEEWGKFCKTKATIYNFVSSNDDLQVRIPFVLKKS
jgi:hypothetical protein